MKRRKEKRNKVTGKRLKGQKNRGEDMMNMTPEMMQQFQNMRGSGSGTDTRDTAAADTQNDDSR